MQDTLLKHVNQNFEATEDKINEQDDLLGSGILDSLGMMKFIAFIETEFNFSIPPEDMIIENFMTIEHVCNYITSKT